MPAILCTRALRVIPRVCPISSPKGVIPSRAVFQAEGGISRLHRPRSALDVTARPFPPTLFYNALVRTWDVIVIGGGIIGLSLSIALRKRGATVLVVERGEPGREASHAAGGMLVDSPLETPSVLQPLATASAKMYPEFAYELEVESGMKVDLRDQGTILFLSKEHIGNPALTSPQLQSTAVSLAELEQLEPQLRKRMDDRAELDLFRQESDIDQTIDEIERFFRSIPGRALNLKERSVDPRALTAAAWKTARHRGVDFSSGDAVTGVNLADGRVEGVTTVKTAFHAAKVVNCAGSWAGQITAAQTSAGQESPQIGPPTIPTRPVKGQMLCLITPQRELIRHVIRSPQVYLIPRSDGRLLVGATVEEAGFDKRTDLATIQRLHKSALALVPKLADAKILEDWAGLRPGTPDALPILGATATPGYYAATGHFRDGILLAPITAEVMTAVIEGRHPEHDLTAFSPERFHERPEPRFQ
jgi:glycine oxidase